MSKAGPLGTGFRFGDNGEGLCAMVLGSDNFLVGATAKSRVSDLRNGAESPGALADDAGSRLSSPSAVVRGLEP